MTGSPLLRSHTGGAIAATLRMIPDIAPVLDRAGRGAWADMWRVAPPLAAMACTLKALRRKPVRTPFLPSF